jgi:ankyrin repeat protein
VVAREELCPSWDALTQADARTSDNWEYFGSPEQQAHRALEARDRPALQRLIAAYPELIAPHSIDMRYDRGPIRVAVAREMESRSPEDREMTDWLVAQGADLQNVLNHKLLGHMRMPTEQVAWLLERGADPNWLPPNGITVLEHALIRYWNGAAVDLIAARVVPRKALWIAAGLGDVSALGRYFDSQDQPNDAAFRHRPDFKAVFRQGYIPPLAIADPQEVIWEAFFVAALNSRLEALDALLQRGFPIDYLGHGVSLLHLAVGNAMVPLVEFLVQRGANPELAQRYGSPRANAENIFQSNPDDERRRILQLVGGRELPPNQTEPARLMQHVERSLELAREEAHRLGQTVVEPHNLVVAMLREDPSGNLLHMLSNAGVSVEQLRRTLVPRLVSPQNETVPEVPLSALVTAILEDARERAESEGKRAINMFHILDGLIRLDNGDIERALDVPRETLERVRQGLFSYGR